MTNQWAWNRILNQFGQDVRLLFGTGEQKVHAFFQPVREKQPGEEPTPLGCALRGHYLYLGPPRPDPATADGLLWEGRRFRFLRCRTRYTGQRPLYQWGLAVETEEGER